MSQSFQRPSRRFALAIFASTILFLAAILAFSPAQAAPTTTNNLASMVIINEVVPKGTEWIELHNGGDTDQDLTGWYLAHTDTTVTETLSGNLPAGGYTTITTILALENSGDGVFLYDNNGTLIDDMHYGINGSAPLAITGQSIARVLDTDTNNDANDWNIDPTPTDGAANDVPGVNL
ncbi:MAG TPA: lamin tail domain-containing protein, partial [Anaerolineae bacterium]|nr:lamin tail domain-containing protein [Anaerolineae bacterium]